MTHPPPQISLTSVVRRGVHTALAQCEEARRALVRPHCSYQKEQGDVGTLVMTRSLFMSHQSSPLYLV